MWFNELISTLAKMFFGNLVILFISDFLQHNITNNLT